MTNYEIKENNIKNSLYSLNVSSDSHEKISRQIAIELSTSNRAGQRRLKTESAGFHAIKSMSDELIDILVRYGNNPDGSPTLLYAAKLGDLRAVQLLIEHGADPFTIDFKGNTALHFALLSRNSQMIEFFLERCLDPNASRYANDHTGEVWQEAVKLNDTKSFELLIAHGLRLDSAYYTFSSQGPSISCIYQGSLDLLQLILSKGGDIPRNEAFGSNQDPVLCAIASDSSGKAREKIECLKWLVSARILDLRNIKEFDIANSYSEFVEYLLNNQHITINHKFNNNLDPLIHRALNKPDILRLVIQKGADINAKGQHGFTVLHNAASYHQASDEHLESIKLLLKSGANVNAMNDVGRTPLSIAQDPKVKKLLIEYGAK